MQSALSGGQDGACLPGPYRETDERLGNGALLPAPATVTACKELLVAGLPVRPEPVDALALGLQHVEVGLA